MQINHILKRPIITEKSMQRISDKKYTFEVAGNATKESIESAVKELFKVDVHGVRVFNRKGKEKRVGATFNTTYTSTRKYAVVTVGEKDKIDLFEEFVAEEDK